MIFLDFMSGNGKYILLGRLVAEKVEEEFMNSDEVYGRNQLMV